MGTDPERIARVEERRESEARYPLEVPVKSRRVHISGRMTG